MHKANLSKFSLFISSFFFWYFSDYYDYIHITQLYKHKYDESIYVHAQAIYTEMICKLKCASASRFIFHFCLSGIFSAELSFMGDDFPSLRVHCS